MKRALLAVLLAASALRLALSLVNTEANDDHMTPIYMIRETGLMPIRGDCHECFQPKLFYVAGAGLIAGLGLEPGRKAVVAVQLMNCAAGVLTLWLALSFVMGLQASPGQKLALFSLAAFNPYLTAIHAQASNDAFAVLFSTAALHQLFAYFRGRGTWGRLALITLCVVLTALTKATGVVLFLGIVLLLLVAAARDRRGLGRAAAFAAGFLLVAPYFGQYVRNWREFGRPFVTNLDPHPLPYFFQETYPARPGITSVFNSYFSFYLPQLLAVPMISADPGPDQYHKTSFWTLLYGTTHALHYYQWPRTWRSKTPAMVNLTRAIFLLALVPTCLLLFGLLEGLAAAAAALRRRDADFLLSERGISLFFSCVFTAFLVAYSLSYRDFGSVKAIYIYPGLLAFLRVLSDGQAAASGRRARPWVNAALAALCFLYVGDVASVIVRLVQIY